MRAKVLRRKRITSNLDGMFASPLFVVVASMGYGKTTAVRSFLESRRDCQHAWFSLRPGEQDERWTWQRLCESLVHLDAERAKRLAEHGLPGNSFELDRAFTLLGGIATRRTVLAIDDYHENRSESLNSFFHALAEATIPNLHVVLISRTYPKIRTDELTLKGLCAELTQADLEFTGEEVSQFFSLNGFDISSYELAEVQKTTDGWAAAVYLTLLKYTESGSVEDVQGITRLIRTAVFDRLDRDTQRILLQLSLLDSFTLQGAVFVTGDPKAADVVRELANSHCFVRHEPRTGSYGLHSILKAALGEIFPVSAVDAAALLVRCGDWCAQSGELIQAVDFYHRAGAQEKILDVYELPGVGGLIDRAPKTIIGAFDVIDLALKLSRPLPYITFIYSYLVAVDPLTGGKMLLEAKAHYEADETLEDKRRILGEIALVESFLQFNDVSRMVSYHEKAYSLLEGGRSLIAQAEGVFTFGSPHALYLYHREPGNLSSLVDVIETEAWRYTHMSNGCGAGFEHLARAEYCLEIGDLYQSEISARKAILKARSKGQVSIITCASMCLSRLAFLRGQPRQAILILDEIRPQVEGSGSQALINSLDIAEGYVNGTLGLAAGIPGWLRDVNLPRNDIYYQGMGMNYLVIAKAMLLDGRFAELEAVVETMREVYRPVNHQFGFIHAGIYDAVAKRHLYGVESAIEALAQAISLARQDGIVTPFAENSVELGEMLALAARQADSAWLNRVKALSEQIARSRTAMDGGLGIKPLSSREVDILTLAREGLSQDEIALRLHVSPNTVNRHFQNVYRKLGVHNKTQALNKARTLGLI